MSRLFLTDRAIISLILLMACFSCNLRTEEHANKVVIPETMLEIKNGSLALQDSVAANCFTLVYFVDSAFCTSCEIANSIALEGLHELENEYSDFKLYVVYAPSEDNAIDVVGQLLKSDVKYPAYVDLHNDFSGLNPFVAELSPPEVFCCLLDKNYNVMLVGNPLRSDKIWAEYKDLIEKNCSLNSH